MPANLHGLNIIHPAQSSFDSQDLLSGSPFPDLSAQLDLWTNLPFESEEGPVPRHDDNFRKTDDDDDEELSRDSGGEAAAIHDGHVNVVTGTNLDNVRGNSAAPPPVFDIQSFLAGFGIDPFANQRLGQPQPPQSAITPSLAQLLALHSAQSAAAPPQTFSGSPSSSYKSIPTPSSDSSSHPPAKRARTRKASVSTVDSPADLDDPTTTPLSATEDKRRRNTAASARFRLKKKEREAALESKAKELETRVNELERECEGLRRENGWLKGLVVGVTGAVQGTATAAPAGVQSKRSRDDDNV